MPTPAIASTLSPCPDCGHPCSNEARSCPNCGKPWPHPRSGSGGRSVDEDTIYAQVLNHSSNKLGSCLTLLGLIKAVERIKNGVSMADELLAIAAITFIVSLGATYMALKQSDPVSKRRAGKVGDLMFTAGLVILLGICVVIAFELS